MEYHIFVYFCVTCFIQNHLFIMQINVNFAHVRIERYHRRMRSCIASARNKSIETGCKEQIADTQGRVFDGLANRKLIDVDMERWVVRLRQAKPSGDWDSFRVQVDNDDDYSYYDDDVDDDIDGDGDDQ